ncbi:uncharacterized protein ACMZJ9_003428 [Mantella aurantiaca]
MASGSLRVAVIGAGGAGLCSARHILSRPLAFEPPVVFEMTGQVGGTWVYTGETGSSAHTHSSMYRDLRTNLPKEIMEFPDFSFDQSLPSFIHHSDVLKYLEDYTDTFSIRPHIKFNTRVVSITPVLEEGKNVECSWEVTHQTQNAGDPVTERFDAVMVCAGHYSHPFVPAIEGLEEFQGQVLHSHYYRYPEVFSSRTVVLLGAGPSGIDIALELSSHAEHVSLSHRGPPLLWTPPKNLSLVPPVVRATSTSLICEDGTEIMADTLIFCTGYKYNYPFLLTGSEVMVDQKINLQGKLMRKNVDVLEELNEGSPQLNETLNVKPVLPRVDLLEDKNIVGTDLEQGHLPPLYKHLFHARYPTLGFIGACKIVLPFPLFHCQVQYFLSVLEGKCQLPPSEKMLSESRKEVAKAQNSGIRLKYLHHLESGQWEYNQWLADIVGFEPLAPVVGKIFEAIRNFRKVDPVLYRSFNVKILNREEFEIRGECFPELQLHRMAFMSYVALYWDPKLCDELRGDVSMTASANRKSQVVSTPFTGQVLHSHFYRYPEVFSSRSVVLLGAGPSGIDIALELSSHAEHVSLSHRGPPLQWTPPRKLSLVPPVVRATSTSLICEDGTEIMADTMIFCTGYEYNYPFLLTDREVMVDQKINLQEKLMRKNIDALEELNEGSLQLNETLNVKPVLPRVDLLEDEDIVGTDVEQGHLPPLYKHLFHARYPTLGFIGACKIVIPFPLFHCQVQCFLNVLEGKIQLPPSEKMLSESREEIMKTQNSGISLKYLHRLGTNQWEYNQWLADTAGFEPLAPVLSKMYDTTRHFRNMDPALYRRLNFKILNREEFEMKGERSLLPPLLILTSRTDFDEDTSNLAFPSKPEGLGQVLHSHYYRYPEVFSFRSVVLLGAGPSGIDIALELSSHAEHVSLSHRGPPLLWTPPKNLSLVPPVVRATSTSLICEDGTEIMADTLIFCTGYKYNYPFLLTGSEVMFDQKINLQEKLMRKNVLEKLNEESPQLSENLNVKPVLPRVDLLEDEDIVGMDVEQGHLPPLYKHLFHARYPTLGFIGACKIVLPFPFCHFQVQCFLNVLEGKCQLPTVDKMLSESREEVVKTQNSGISLKYLHRLGTNPWEYNQWLADTTGFEPLAPVLNKMYEATLHFWNMDPALYRRFNFKILSREEFEMRGEVLEDDQRL